jgi:hypothetical protein
MATLPPRQQQIIMSHATLINRVVEACGNPALLPEVEPILDMSEKNGWGVLVAAIRKVLAGRRDQNVLMDLDEEDTVIVEAILRGIQDPSTLPDPNAKPDATLAAPGLATMIDQAGRGNAQVLGLLASMAEQMSKAGGDMTRLAGIMRHMVNGERDADKLTKGMGPEGKALVLSILEELGKLSLH